MAGVRLINLVMATSALLNRENRLWRPVTTHSYLGESDMRSLRYRPRLIRVGSLNSRGFPNVLVVAMTDYHATWIQIRRFGRLSGAFINSWPPNRWVSKRVAFRTLGAGDDLATRRIMAYRCILSYEWRWLQQKVTKRENHGEL